MVKTPFHVYLVGGAVRDQLLNLPVKDRDWVIVGATPQSLIDLGYQQVGKDFPVFLHPQSKEEYALARTERKSGQGYTGFICDFSADITLEQDLIRRDLTINAMAQDLQGNLYDPYHGADDLQQRILRHVSPAFVEDPLRVLRVARFAARYHHLGFTIAPETLQLMQTLTLQSELQHLTAERVWAETEKALNEKNPEIYFETLRQVGALAVLFPRPESRINQGLFCPYRVTFARIFLIRSAVCLRVIRFRQTGQYLTLLEVDAKNAPHSVHFFLSPVW